MNGIDAVALATGNDWRALEAGAHAYAARAGSYGALATWRVEGEDLVGRIELPIAVRAASVKLIHGAAFVLRSPGFALRTTGRAHGRVARSSRLGRRTASCLSC